MKSESKRQKLWGGILLVAGTTIGAGMLAQPVVMGMVGYVPTLCLFTLFWLFMTFTAFLILEANLWVGKGANLISMAHATLGKWGEIVSWCAYLFLLYMLTTAYLAGCGPILIAFIAMLTGIHLPLWGAIAPVLLLFGFVVFRGTSSVDHLNRVMMGGLAFAYVLLLAYLLPVIEVEQLQFADWGSLYLTIGLVATSFGFHIVIPTLTEYLEGDVQLMRRAIWIGSLIPLGVYLLWETAALGILPLEGSDGILEGFRQGSNGAQMLATFLGHPLFSVFARLFAFFAILTSFLGVTLSLSDFLTDGLKIPHTAKGKLLVCLLTFIPPLIFVLTDARAFLNALDYAGSFGVMLLLGWIPIMMVWSGRYRQNRQGAFVTPGGKGALVLAKIFALGVLLFVTVDKVVR
ncbi:MAG: tyrosine transporter [Chlamydiia bacterium]|nr:tyrosine transporter [Chlamydiia bacterium]